MESGGEIMKDYKYTLSTGEGNRIQQETDKIKGKFGAILIRNNTAWYRLKIFMRDYPDVVLFDEDSTDMRSMSRGACYAIVKTNAYNTSNKDYGANDRSQSEFWILNDVLVIQLDGGKNTTTEVVLRCLDGI